MSTTYHIPGELLSAWRCKCPRCRKGDLFDGPLLGFKSKKMKEKCPHCHLRFEKEPGYFYVAMYVSYAFVCAQLIGACMLTFVITQNDESPWLYLSVALGATLLLAPFNYRYSRVVLLYWMTPQFRFRKDFYEAESLPE